MAAEAFKQSPCEPCCYGVLDDVSIAYPPATGMLLTRYAPFRRSPPEYCYPALPLDLHVLSLPLAFILSQDQTLHCKNCSLYLLDSSSCPPPIYLYIYKKPTHAISVFSSVSMHCRLPKRKTIAKVHTFSKTTKYFFTFLFIFFTIR